MPKGSQWQKRPVDVIVNADHVAKIAPGEMAGTKARQDSTTRSKRSVIVRKAATAEVGRWLSAREHRLTALASH